MKSYNYTTLAVEAGISYKTLSKEIKTMLSDPAIRSEYGEVKRNRISRKQLEILSKHIVGLEHLAAVTQ